MSEINELTQKVTEEYDASQIQVLEGLEAVRKRPGMYIGSTSSSGLHHLVYEIVDNSIDEALAGYCTHIEVSIEPGDIIRVSDNGRGIPVDIQEQTGKSALEVVFSWKLSLRCCTPAASSAAGAIRSRAVFTASALRWSMHFPSGWWFRSIRTEKSTRCVFPAEISLKKST